jgi:hypothetical protein
MGREATDAVQTTKGLSRPRERAGMARIRDGLLGPSY